MMELTCGGVRLDFFTKLFEELFCDDNQETHQDIPKNGCDIQVITTLK